MVKFLFKSARSFFSLPRGVARSLSEGRRALSYGGLGLTLTLSVLGCKHMQSLGSLELPPAPVISRLVTHNAWPDVDYAILEDVATVTYKEISDPLKPGYNKLIAVLDHRRRFQILNAAGLAAAHVRLPMDSFSTITRLVARSLEPSGKTHQLDADEIYQNLRPEIALMAKRSPAAFIERAKDLQVVEFNIPEPVVGGIVEYRYERVYELANLIPPWVFAVERAPVLHAELSVLVPPHLKVDYRYGHGEEVLPVTPMREVLANGLERLSFVEVNVPALYSEKEMPHPTKVAPWLALTVTNKTAALEEGEGRPLATHDHLESWSGVAESVTALLLESAAFKEKDNEEDRVISGVGASGAKTLDLARAQEIYKSVQKRILGVYGGDLTGLGVLSFGDLKGAEALGAVCMREATALLLKAFLEAGYKAYPVLVSSLYDPQALWGFPAFYPFSWSLVALDRGAEQQPLLVDPLCRYCTFGELTNDLGGGKALIIKEHFWGDKALAPLATTAEESLAMPSVSNNVSAGSSKKPLNKPLSVPLGVPVETSPGAVALEPPLRTSLAEKRVLSESDSTLSWLTVPLDAPLRNLFREEGQLFLDVNGALKGRWEIKLQGFWQRLVRKKMLELAGLSERSGSDVSAAEYPRSLESIALLEYLLLRGEELNETQLSNVDISKSFQTKRGDKSQAKIPFPSNRFTNIVFTEGAGSSEVSALSKTPEYVSSSPSALQIKLDVSLAARATERNPLATSASETVTTPDYPEAQISETSKPISLSGSNLGEQSLSISLEELLGGSFTANVYRPLRRYSAILQAPFWHDSVLTLVLPTGCRLSLPPTNKLVSPWAEYAIAITAEQSAPENDLKVQLESGVQEGASTVSSPNNTLVNVKVLKISRRLVFKTKMIKAAEWPDFYNFISQVRALEAGLLRFSF